MDRDMIPLCDALNALPGTRTLFCCSGHGRGNPGEFYVLMGASNARSMRRVCRAFDVYGLKDCAASSPYMLEAEAGFWALRGNEVSLRVSNPWVDTLKAPARKKEFGRIIKRLKEDRP